MILSHWTLSVIDFILPNRFLVKDDEKLQRELSTNRDVGEVYSSLFILLSGSRRVCPADRLPAAEQQTVFKDSPSTCRRR